MAKKRRKSDKIRAKERLATKLVKKSTKSKIKPRLHKDKPTQQEKVPGLFNYDPKLISHDLKKTLIVTLVVLVVLALITLRYT